MWSWVLFDTSAKRTTATESSTRDSCVATRLAHIGQKLSFMNGGFAAVQSYAEMSFFSVLRSLIPLA